MLTRFSVENFLSFRDRIEFSMIAGKSTRLASHVKSAENYNDFRRLKSAVIYGANASGKTNLIRAIDFMKRLVLFGTKSESRISLPVFKLGDEPSRPSRFEIEFVIADRSYAYGFVLTEKIVKEEWLYEAGRKRQSEIFSRKYDENGNLIFTHAGLNFSEKRASDMFETLAEFCPENQLFATEYKNGRKRIHSHIPRELLQSLEDLLDWFSKKLSIIFPDTINLDNSRGSAIDGVEMNDAISEIINCFDTGILKIKLTKMSRAAVAEKIPEKFLDQIEADLKDGESSVLIHPVQGERITIKRIDGQPQFFKICAEHENPSDGTTLLDFVDESDGTKRLFDLIPAYINLLSEPDSVLIIDEIDRSLHTQIASSLLNSFHECTAGSSGQMIVTTHETNLLDQKSIRKDEVWFVNKKKGSSSLYSLEEYLPRYDTDLRSAYLKGRFGAVPLIYSSPSNICRKVVRRDAARNH
jgi:AAA15 family ATPase/GTPase